MLLTIDIGNTNIKWCLFDGDDPIVNFRIATDRDKTSDEYAVIISTFLNLKKIDLNNINGAIISSVVPILTGCISQSVESVFGIKSLIVGPGIKTGLNILLDDPAQLGSDLVCACIAASKLYSYPSIIISMGTATAICTLDKKSNMRGGLIAPGLNISLKALTSSGSLLPSVSLQAPENVIGRNTIDCIKSGVIIGEACRIDGLIDRIEKELGSKCSIIATGGLAKYVIPSCTHDIILDDNLIVKGLKILYYKNSKH